MLQKMRFGAWMKCVRTMSLQSLYNCQKYQRIFPSSIAYPLFRHKYTLNKGVKGIRNHKTHYEAAADEDKDEEENKDNGLWSKDLNMDDNEYEAVASGAMNVSRNLTVAHSVLVIQPYVKWGPKKNHEVTPEDELTEAEALIGSLPNWRVAHALKVPVESLDRKILFGKGKLEELKLLVQKLREKSVGQQHHQSPLSCLFVSKSTLSFAQKCALEEVFHLPVMDRYSVVIQILRLHATSAEARLQVAMAELPYIWAQAKDANPSKSSRMGYALTETQREIIKTRERKLKHELNVIRSQRKLLRKKRQQDKLPIVAVVGYTNAGKTSLIKALTQEEEMQPRDQLFATLDVTAHGGHLPSNLQVIYMDTVGFMRNLPTGLMECFVATLEDALLADLILHVQDVSHPNYAVQTEHVESTLKKLGCNMDLRDASTGEQLPSPPILRVANKIDLVENAETWKDCLKISCKHSTGLAELLKTIEDSILEVTGRRKLTIRVPQGGQEMAWLYKNSAVSHLKADPNSSQHLLMEVILTEHVFQQFQRQFCH